MGGAHAGAAPHEGVNALNAATIALSAIHAQRETFKDEDYVLTFEDDLAVHYSFVTFLAAGPSRSCSTSKLTRSPSHRFLNRGVLIER